jgi:hypothetical protein
MDADQKEIADFLKSYPGQYVSAKEICKRAGGKWRFREDEKWALPVLQRMVEQKLVEADTTGHFRLAPDNKKKDQKKWWASPDMKKILEESGKQFDNVLDVEKDEE